MVADATAVGPAATTVARGHRQDHQDRGHVRRRADIVTSEPGWHYDGSDPKVRRYTKPIALERACWRVETGAGCECRALTADERAFGL